MGLSRQAFYQGQRRHIQRECRAEVVVQWVGAKAIEQVWVADITYLSTNDKFVYLSLVTNAYSRKIVGWHVHESL
jgi:transposase InsO family protein